MSNTVFFWLQKKTRVFLTCFQNSFVPTDASIHQRRAKELFSTHSYNSSSTAVTAIPHARRAGTRPSIRRLRTIFRKYRSSPVPRRPSPKSSGQRSVAVTRAGRVAAPVARSGCDRSPIYNCNTRAQLNPIIGAARARLLRSPNPTVGQLI